MKTLRNATIALASAGIALSAPLAAQDHSQHEDNTIFVQPTSAEAEYVTQVGQQLDRNLARFSFPLRTQVVGVVRVRFTANHEGEAENLTLIGESGSNQLDRAALWAIGRLNDITPDFEGSVEGREIQANIVFANSERQAERMIAQVMREEAIRMAEARERGEPQVLALTLGAAARTR